MIWNINTNDMGPDGDNNLFCLYTVENNKLNRYLGLPNTYYMKQVATSYMPNMVLKSNSYWFIMKLIPDRWTMGCSKKHNYSSTYQDLKFKLLLEHIVELSRIYNFSLLFTLIEGQYGYLPTLKEDKIYTADIYNYLKIMHSLGAPTIRIAGEIKTLVQNPQYTISTQSAQLNVLGIASQNLTETLFLKNDGFDFGSKHMNEIGNRLVADVVFKNLIKIIN